MYRKDSRIMHLQDMVRRMRGLRRGGTCRQNLPPFYGTDTTANDVSFLPASWTSDGNDQLVESEGAKNHRVIVMDAESDIAKQILGQFIIEKYIHL